MDRLSTRAPRLGLWAATLALLVATGCQYNDHHNFGMTEKWVASDVNRPTKMVGTVVTSIVDSIVSPFTMWADLTDPPYEPGHRYFSYAGSRTIARSDMPLTYQWIGSVISIPVETIWLLLTGPIDLITVLSR